MTNPSQPRPYGSLSWLTRARVETGVVALLGGACAVAAYVFSVDGGATEDQGHRRIMYVWGAVFVFVGCALAAVHQYRRDREAKEDLAALRRRTEEAEDALVHVAASSHIMLQSVVVSIADLVGQVAAARSKNARNPLRAKLMQRIVDAAVENDHQLLRAAFYLRQPDTGPIERLVLQSWAGRGTPPRQTFVRGQQTGPSRDNAVIDLVEQRAWDFVVDVNATPQAACYQGKDYRTFACVAVSAGQRPCGILAVDAPAPGDLDDTVMPLLRALASLLGAGMAP